ncbi:hypothetical protein V6N13_048768 [Hibiscus sabdariffa]|uniref:Uncharacterized protein n=1 Tax=Hibiscus sabdariffa TaxID=183260 RepID=A0ABR2DIN6_9ROSI
MSFGQHEELKPDIEFIKRVPEKGSVNEFEGMEMDTMLGYRCEVQIEQIIDDGISEKSPGDRYERFKEVLSHMGKDEIRVGEEKESDFGLGVNSTHMGNLRRTTARSGRGPRDS